jgi:hypothetical protein
LTQANTHIVCLVKGSKVVIHTTSAVPSLARAPHRSRTPSRPSTLLHGYGLHRATREASPSAITDIRRGKGDLTPALPLNGSKTPILDFLGLNDGFLERDLENAILREAVNLRGLHAPCVLRTEQQADLLSFL